MDYYFLEVHHKHIGYGDCENTNRNVESQRMEDTIFKIKAATALLQNMVSTEEEIRYNDLALFYIAKMLYEGIDELERCYAELKNDKTGKM